MAAITKPNKWIAALLGFFAFPFGTLYAGSVGWSVTYFSLAIAIFAQEIFFQYQLEAISSLLPILCAAGCSLHSYFLAKRCPDDLKRPWFSRWFGIVGIAVVYVTLIGLFRAFVYEPFRFSASSMLPTIEKGAYLVISKWGFGNYGTYGVSIKRGEITSRLARGDIVVFEYPPNRDVHYAKRLIGLPGDRITYKDKQLYINGEMVKVALVANAGDIEPGASRYIEALGKVSYSILRYENQPAPFGNYPFSRSGCDFEDAVNGCTIPENQFFVMGDNRDRSSDSRYWGFVPSDHIVGKVIYNSTDQQK